MKHASVFERSGSPPIWEKYRQKIECVKWERYQFRITILPQVAKQTYFLLVYQFTPTWFYITKRKNNGWSQCHKFNIKFDTLTILRLSCGGSFSDCIVHWTMMMTNIAGFLIRSLVNTMSAASLRLVLLLSHPLKDEQQWDKKDILQNRH